MSRESGTALRTLAQSASDPALTLEKLFRQLKVNG